nr:AC084762_14 putative transposon protein [Ipomoea batatas]
MLTREKRLKFAEFLKSVKFLDGYASNITRCVNADGDFFRKLCCKTLKLADLDVLRNDIVIILCKLEMIYPLAFFDVMVYLAIHLPQEAALGGPVQFRWMFMIERFLGSLKHYVRNKAHPEGSIAEGYVANECLTFLSLYLNGVETRFNKPDRNNDRQETHDGLSIFSHKCDWFDIGKKSCIQHDGIFTSIKVSSFWYKNDPYVLASQAKQVFYLNDPKLGLNWRVVQQFQHRHIYDENEVGSIPDDKDDTHDNNDVYQDNEMVSTIIVPSERIEPKEDFVISDDEDESPIEYDSNEEEMNDDSNEIEDS